MVSQAPSAQNLPSNNPGFTFKDLKPKYIIGPLHPAFDRYRIRRASVIGFVVCMFVSLPLLYFSVKFFLSLLQWPIAALYYFGGGNRGKSQTFPPVTSSSSSIAILNVKV